MKSSSLSSKSSVCKKATSLDCSDHGRHEFYYDLLPTDIAEESGVSELEDSTQFQVRRFTEEREMRDLGGRFKGNRFGQQAISVAQLQENFFDLPEAECCSCHICDPREEFECKDMLEAIRRGLVSLAYAIRELGEMFRHFLEIEDPELAELAVEY